MNLDMTEGMSITISTYLDESVDRIQIEATFGECEHTHYASRREFTTTPNPRAFLKEALGRVVDNLPELAFVALGRVS